MGKTYMSYPRYAIRAPRSPFAKVRWRLFDLAGMPIFVRGMPMGSFETPDDALAYLRFALAWGFLEQPRPFAAHVGTWVRGTTRTGRNQLFEGYFALSGLDNVEEGDVLLLSNDVPQDAGDRTDIARSEQPDNRPRLPDRVGAAAGAALQGAPQEQGQGVSGLQPEEEKPSPDYLALARSL